MATETTVRVLEEKEVRLDVEATEALLASADAFAAAFIIIASRQDPGAARNSENIKNRHWQSLLTQNRLR